MLTPAQYVTTPGGWGQAHGVWDRAVIESYLSVQFQNGPAQTRGVNGVQLLDVLTVCRDFAKALNSRKGGASRECSSVITKLDEAIHWEKDRVEMENSRERAAERASGRSD